MRASLAWLRKLTDLPPDAGTVADRLTNAGFVVAAVEPHGADHVLDVEVTYNRPDLLSHIGLARELAGLVGAPLRTPESAVPAGHERPDAIPVEVEAGDLCPLYTGRVVRGVRVGPSPAWLSGALEAAGQRTVNNVVDVTNYVMLECGQPLHAFDLAKLRGPRIVVRRGRGEGFAALDGRTIQVGADDLAICDESGPAALAGVMGGAGSEVSPTTTDVLLESAVFAPLGIRATSRRHQFRSESSYRFERFVDPAGVVRASDRAARLLAEVCGAAGVGPVVAAGPGVAAQRPAVELRADRLAHVLGVAVPDAEVRVILTSLGLEARTSPRERVTAWSVPSWRPDLVAEIDLIEEVGRRIGFERVPARTSLVVRPLTSEPGRRAQERIRDSLVAQGLRECISAPFVAEGASDVALLVVRPALRVTNPMRAEECLLRRSLLGPLLATARRNQERGATGVRIFESGPVYSAGAEGGATEEVLLVAGLVSGAYSDAKGCVEAVLEALGLEPAVSWETGGASPLRADRSARIRIDGEVVGVVGEFSTRAVRTHALSGPAAAFELRADRLGARARLERPLDPVSRYPAVERDVAWVVSDDVSWRRLEDTARAAGAPLVQTVRFLSEFRGPQVGAGRKSVAFRMELRAADRTLTGADADACMGRVVAALTAASGGELRA